MATMKEDVEAVVAHAVCLLKGLKYSCSHII